jgi:PAS domain S-box-containing protein
MRTDGIKQYALALACVLAVILLRAVLAPVLGYRSPFLLFTLAIMVAAAYGGLHSGIAATVLSTVAGALLFSGDFFSYSAYELGDFVNVAMFVGIGFGISTINDRVQRLRRVAAAEEEKYRLLVESVTDYAIYGLDPKGCVVSWNAGAERITGYSADEIIGRHYSTFHTPEERETKVPERELQLATYERLHRIEGWRVRKDGTRFWAESTITSLRTPDGTVKGFSKVTRDTTERKQAEIAVQRLNAELELRVEERTRQLQEANTELESFSYSVSHDLRAPLRSIDGFGNILLRDYAAGLDGRAQDLIRRMRTATVRMGQLIEALLNLSRLTRQPLRRQPVELNEMAEAIIAELQSREPERSVRVAIQSQGMTSECDPKLMRVVLDNLLGNAWKFSRYSPNAAIEFTSTPNGENTVFCVRDNGAGFDMEYKATLFVPFQRLHSADEFEGSGIGLATAQRIIHRHGGSIWAESEPGKGAAFFFTIN